MNNLKYNDQIGLITKHCDKELLDTIAVDKILALILLNNLNLEDFKKLKHVVYDKNTIAFGNEEYMILDDDEADNKYEEYIESAFDDYLPEVIAKEFRKGCVSYEIDGDWIEVKLELNMGGRGNLAYYDGLEHLQQVNGVDYFIYRIS